MSLSISCRHFDQIAKLKMAANIIKEARASLKHPSRPVTPLVPRTCLGSVGGRTLSDKRVLGQTRRLAPLSNPSNTPLESLLMNLQNEQLPQQYTTICSLIKTQKQNSLEQCKIAGILYAFAIGPESGIRILSSLLSLKIETPKIESILEMMVQDSSLTDHDHIFESLNAGGKDPEISLV